MDKIVKFWFWLDRLTLIAALIGFGIEILPEKLWGGIFMIALAPLSAFCFLSKNSIRKKQKEPIGNPLFNVIVLAMIFKTITEDDAMSLGVMAVVFVMVDLIYWMLLSFHKPKE